MYIKLSKDTNTEILDKISSKRIPNVDYWSRIDCIIRAMIEKEVIDTDNLPALNLVYDHTKSVFRPEAYHATFMRIKK